MDQLSEQKRKVLGRRERGKLERRRRIREATREVFRRKGYEAATTREIAELADVALGTLFAYAKDKRELLMIVINDDREALPEVHARDCKGPGDILAVLTSFFEPRYRYWAKEPELSRLAVQQTIDYNLARDPGPELARFELGRKTLVKQLADFFAGEQKRGNINDNRSADSIAWLFMYLYQGEVRQWLRADKPNAAAGMRKLRDLFSLALSGVVPPSQPPKEPRAKPGA
jgi:AcrR family transcriptional regulator